MCPRARAQSCVVRLRLEVALGLCRLLFELLLAQQQPFHLGAPLHLHRVQRAALTVVRPNVGPDVAAAAALRACIAFT
eukprot:3695446-Pleurochrysis_carterae.AAC.1